MTAAKYLVAHNVAYQHLTVSEDNAKEQFMELGATCAAVRAQATRVAEAEAMLVKLDAPGDTSADTVVVTVAEATVTDAAETELAATADCGDDSGDVGSVHNQSLDADEDQPPPGFQCVAAELTSADLDVERCCKEFAAKLQLLAARAQRLGGGDDAVEQELTSLKALAETMSKADLQAKLDEFGATDGCCGRCHSQFDG